MKILVATHNAGKLREYAELLADVAPGGKPVEWVSLADLGIEADVEETGATFEENARLKAVAYARQSGLLTLADDSGLEVDALDGGPGVRSARYGGPGLDDAGRYRLLLENLEGVHDAERGGGQHAGGRGAHRRRHLRGPHRAPAARRARLRLRPGFLRRGARRDDGRAWPGGQKPHQPPRACPGGYQANTAGRDRAVGWAYPSVIQVIMSQSCWMIRRECCDQHNGNQEGRSHCCG
jgi:hypothetical protein